MKIRKINGLQVASKVLLFKLNSQIKLPIVKQVLKGASLRQWEGQGIRHHQDISTTTNIYTHLLEENRRETSKIIDEALRSNIFSS